MDRSIFSSFMIYLIRHVDEAVHYTPAASPQSPQISPAVWARGQTESDHIPFVYYTYILCRNKYYALFPRLKFRVP
jgi:hypothetical protein